MDRAFPWNLVRLSLCVRVAARWRSVKADARLVDRAAPPVSLSGENSRCHDLVEESDSLPLAVSPPDVKERAKGENKTRSRSLVATAGVTATVPLAG